MSRRKEPSAKRSGKKAYRTPALRVHGDIREITGPKGGTKSDGVGNPKTKTVGTG